MVARRVLEGALTDVQVRAWIRAGEPVAKSDGGGLTFTLSKAGTASWVLRYSVNNKRSELTLGNYPDMSLATARKLAREKRVEVDQGTNPAAERKEAKLKAKLAKSLSDGIDSYREKVLTRLSTSTQRTYGRQLRRLEKRLGRRPPEEILPLEMVSLLEATVAGHGRREAEMLLVAAREVFKHISGKRAIRIDPCALIDLTAIAGKPPPVKKRLMLSNDELGIVMNAPMNRQNQLSVRILLGTCARVSELAETLKANVRIDAETIRVKGAGIWHIPDSKTSVGIDIPLVGPVLEWFRELIHLSGDSGYLLPARTTRRLKANGGDTHIGKDTIWGALITWIEQTRPAPLVRRFTPHDLRSSAKSHLRALGVSRDISEMCLNHKLRGVEGIYDQYTYWPERRDALTKWADHLIACQGRDQGAYRVARDAVGLLAANGGR